MTKSKRGSRCLFDEDGVSDAVPGSGNSKGSPIGIPASDTGPQVADGIPESGPLAMSFSHPLHGIVCREKNAIITG